MSAERLRFAPDILRRLGEELIPHAEQGILELVRNAYDADASACDITLRRTGKRGGSILIEDDGVGMAAVDIIDGWLVLGRSRKAIVRARSRRGRLAVGDKGLGRLAALRLGARASLATRPRAEPGTEYRLSIEWGRFDHANVVEDVALEVTKHRTTKPSGTRIEISGIARVFGVREVQRLARALVLLADPFEPERGFRASLTAPGFAKYERLVRHGYLAEASYHLEANLDAHGRAAARVVTTAGQVLWQADHKRLSSTGRLYRGPAARFELWTFNMGGARYSTTGVTQGALRTWLAAVGGVHLYHRGLRVYPYGDPGHDWLDMNLARVRSPEERPSTNNSVGRVEVVDAKGVLLQKTDRTGFVETPAFEELRRFSTDALEWMADERLKKAEGDRRARKLAAPRQVRRAKTAFAEAVKDLPPEQRAQVEDAADALDRARRRQLRVVREDLELYRMLSTLGTTVAVFAHESAKPVTNIELSANTIKRRAAREFRGNDGDWLVRPLERILASVADLETYAKLPKTLLNRRKRDLGAVHVHNVIEESVNLFTPFLRSKGVTIERRLVDGDPVIRTTVASLEAILTNLMTNAINALTSPEAPSSGRQIHIETGVQDSRLLLRVMDNGPGIRGIALDDIWLPGRSTTDKGMGLGLTIVRDAVEGLRGEVRAIACGALGGAEFLITLPSEDGDR